MTEFIEQANSKDIQERQTYLNAGVDVETANAAVNRIRQFASATLPGTGGAAPIGHFGGFYQLDGDENRLLVASADGIGTKIRIAILMGGDAHTGVGRDLVNHCVNDVVACGAKPLFFLDYIAMGSLDPHLLESLVAGIANACRENRVALIGGETAEMPGIYQNGDYDVAGFVVGEVAPDSVIDGRRVQTGNTLIGFSATGLHTNGFSLARHILGLTGDVAHDREVLAQMLPGVEQRTIGDALLAPHPSYLDNVRDLLRLDVVHGIAHITGGGMIDNIPRMLPEEMVAEIVPESWKLDALQQYLVEQGNLSESEKYRAFNMGIGMVLAIETSAVETCLAVVPDAMVIGLVRQRIGDERQVSGLVSFGQ